MKYKIGLIAFISLLITGCATHNIQNILNEKYIEVKSPIRMIKDTSFKSENAVRYIEGWAGTKGISAINNEYKEKSFQHFQENCGYGKNDFIEARIVEHTKTSWEEVWLFHDPKSFRDDQVSGITIFFQYFPKSNQTTVDFFGACHTQKGSSFTESN